jgi:hypothetical protein
MSAARILTTYRTIFGALLLVWRRAQWVGAAALLAVFACAQVTAAPSRRS